ncbi:peptide chain release factor N(5)-glutamine methyltransferase [Novosphingobium sp.]|uniref:peptide chain release factor N(5)-glutamine methyltransferase n=1 Tax=Novosphingobium sp. TaxID=1874826 RepID=UPI0025D98DD1|nr:peptide chain release factor N(5)-glutamine methyltransferase [Novosphingobium sp.]
MPDTTIGGRLRIAAAELGEVSPSARLDVELLMAAALGVSRSDLLLRHMRDAVPASFDALYRRRLAHEPVAYILGQAEFYGLELRVTPAVLIPRADSETLIDAALAAFAAQPPYRILDCGTGSGALLLAALAQWPGATGVGIDRSGEALAIAAENAHRLELAERVRLLQHDWETQGWADDLGLFELVLANPPYVETDAPLARVVRDHEPAGALFAGPEGLDAYRILVPQLPGLLAPGGVALVEIGSSQAAAVTALAADSGLSADLHRDLAGRPRALEMRDQSNISLGKRRTPD